MGLGDYKKYKFEKQLRESEVISFLLKKVEELENRLDSQPKVVEKKSSYESLSEEERKMIKDIADKSIKPEDVIKQFAGNLEEFNPHA